MSWYSLVAVSRAREEIKQSWESRPPMACPNDGEPLRMGPDNELFCAYDGWRPGGGHV